MKTHSISACLLVTTLAFCSISRGAETWYARPVRDLITPLTRGSGGALEKAKNTCESYIAKSPDDQEYRFMLAICYARERNISRAMELVRESVGKGLPFERYLAGPRDVLAPLTSSDEFKAYAAKQDAELIHGPLLGSVTDKSARFWVRTYREVPVEVSVSAGRREAARAAARTDEERDYTAVLSVSGLTPGTRYQYRLTIEGTHQRESHEFRTMPPQGKPAKFVIAFGGGAGYTPRHERMWKTIKSHEPIALLLLGDNVYIDTPKVQNTQKYCYYRRQGRPEFRALTASTSVSAIWDDHDFATDDSQGGPRIASPDWKIPVWKTFRNNWNNPAYGGGEELPGCWFTQSIADVDFFFIDGRYYRHRAGKTMLGSAQKKELLRRLKNSNAVFKVICSNVPISKGAKPGWHSWDPWDGFPEEREEIYRFLADNSIDGVFVIAADRHRSDAWKNERAGPYPIYEFQSSRLTNVHTHRLIGSRRCLFGYNKLCSFGRLTFDTTRKDPEVTYDIINIDNETVESFALQKSLLTSR